eukprot:TRINITY_DN5174_c0_g2_i13.p1 TRINITY_DN5174_c0_g2~~TRINITY_DN5174_c0_g2_i13.p1  ORF type:complete len:501 (-),score=47.81 TRINITY_DN5174_c0_g2_i13:62-1564(-)
MHKVPNMSKLPHCTICLEQFGCIKESRIPRILPCGHSYCTRCLGDLISKSSLVICPACHQVHVPSSGKGADCFVKNYVLMDIMGRIPSVVDEEEETSDSLSEAACSSSVPSSVRSSPSSSVMLSSPRGPLEPSPRSSPPTPQKSPVAPPQQQQQLQQQLPQNEKNLSTSDTHLMTAIQNVAEGQTLDLKEMMVVGDGPLHIKNRVTIRNANFCVGGGVIIDADAVSLIDVTISVVAKASQQNSQQLGNLIVINGNECKVQNCRLEVLQLNPECQQFAGINIEKGSLSLSQTTIVGCHMGVVANGVKVDVQRCNITVNSSAVLAKNVQMSVEACNLQSFSGSCVGVTDGQSTVTMKECSLIAMGEQVVSMSGVGTKVDLDRCRMQAGKVAAVKVDEFAKLKMEHCEVGGNQEDTLVLRSLEVSKFQGLRGTGVLVKGQASAHLLNCSMARVPYGVVGVGTNTNIKVECCNLITMLTHIFVEHGASLIAHHCNLVDAMGILW